MPIKARIDMLPRHTHRSHKGNWANLEKSKKSPQLEHHVKMFQGHEVYAERVTRYYLIS